MKKLKLLVTLIVFATLNCSAQFTKLFDFNSTGTNGRVPLGSLISDGTFLYGMTMAGGTNSFGNLFKIKPDGTAYEVLINFDSLNSGCYPQGTLFYDSTFLYGMTEQGGASGNGTIFKIKTDGTGYTKLADFNGSNGKNPYYGSLVSDGIFLYGMTSIGGKYNNGVIFRVKPDGSVYDTLISFNGINGNYPLGSLIYDSTFLYGMTEQGGANGNGVIFKIKTDGTGYTKLADFNGSNGNIYGSHPYGSLIYNGTFLYGMTYNGGNGGYGDGVIFKIKTDGTGYVKLIDFDGINGSYPNGSLILDGNYLYGMTADGINSNGNIFKIKLDGTGYADLMDFTSTSGIRPYGSLISDGTFLYGMLSSDGVYNSGTIFKIGINTIAGITENKEQTDITIFPNPTNGIINLQGQHENAQIKICDVLGKSIYQNNSSASNLQIDLSSQPSGVYFVNIQTSEGMVNKKIVINR